MIAWSAPSPSRPAPSARRYAALGLDRSAFLSLPMVEAESPPVSGADPPAAVFFYSPDRAGMHPGQHLAGYSGIPRTDRCPDRKQSCPWRRATAAANHGVDLLSGCRSLGLRYTLILRRRVSNAIVCDFKKRMSSIRRSSLSSTTLLGMFTVIDATFVCLSVRMADGLQRIFVCREIQKQIYLSIITLK
jgi:hypothetical protein